MIPVIRAPNETKLAKLRGPRLVVSEALLQRRWSLSNICPRHTHPMLGPSAELPSFNEDVLCRQCKRHWCQSLTREGTSCPRCKSNDTEMVGPFSLEIKALYMEGAARRRQQDITNIIEENDAITEFSSAIGILRQNVLLEDLGRPVHAESLSGIYFPSHFLMPSLLALEWQ